MDATNFNEFEIATLYPYRSLSISPTEEISDLLQKVVVGSYVEALKDEQCQHLFSKIDLSSCAESSKVDSITEYIKEKIQDYLKLEGAKGEQVLYCVALSCLQLFVQNNFTGPNIGPKATEILFRDVETEIFRNRILNEIALDTEGIYTLISEPEYLLMSKIIFMDLRSSFPNCIAINWWCCRYLTIHQKVSEELSPLFFETILDCLHSMENETRVMDKFRDISALFHLEAAHIMLQYYDIGKANVHVKEALSILALDISINGALGVRTKWQQKELAQLVVKVEYSGKPIAEEELKGPFLLPTDLPKDILLDDDTRLHKIKFKEIDEDVIPNLRPLEQLALFTYLFVKRKSTVQDEILTEESKAYLMSVLQYPKNWLIQFGALFLRSKIECSELRAMERTLNQFEELVNCFGREEPSRFERLKLAYACPLNSYWNVQQELARMYMKLGCTKTALELFEKLHLWEDIIICYNELQMRQRSAEVIRNLLEKEETPKLWCLLGDATDDISCYNKALELSNYKSGRAQRCLGNYYYVRKDYHKAIEHFDRSVEINSLQFPVWQRLAYCALQVEDWKKCIVAYKRCSILEPDSFECWNNMSQAYINVGEKYKAWKSLQEALRCKTDSWRVWDNYMLVSTSLGYMTQAIYAYNQILIYKAKHVDTDVLRRVVKAIVDKIPDPDGRTSKFLHKECLELVGKLTREVPQNGELWYLNAELSRVTPERSTETLQISVQYYRKSVATEMQKSNWEVSTEHVQMMLFHALKLVEVSKELAGEVKSKSTLTDLNSIKMLIRNIIYSIKKSQIDNATGCIVESIRIPLASLEEGLDHINGLILQLNS